MNVPSDLKYTTSHEWILNDDGVVNIGITDFAQTELGDVVYVELPTVGQILQKDEAFGSVESVKTVSELYSPVAGEIVAVNESLAPKPELVNSDPYGEGWLIRIKMSNAVDLDELLNAADYARVIEES